MRKFNKRANQSAFTLIETLIALLILLIGLIAIAQLFVAATYSNVFAQNATVELKELEDALEQLHAINDWTNASIVPGGTVVMEDDTGGVAATSLPATSSTGGADQAHIIGVMLTPIKNAAGRLLYFA